MPSVPTPRAADESSIVVKAAYLKAQTRQRLLADLRKTWGKFDDDELRHLRHIDDLVSQLVLKYGMDEEKARRDANAVVDGRNF